jgi:hypothetical protein
MTPCGIRPVKVIRLSSRCEFDSRSLRGVLDTTLCVNVFQWLVSHCWFSPCTPVFSIIKTYLHDITEILLKVALSNISTNKTDCHDITEIVLHVALVHGENQQYVASHWKTLSHSVVSSTPRSKRESNSQRGERRTLPIRIVLIRICKFQ